MSLNPHSLDEPLAALLSSEIACARNLEALLEREYYCIETRDLEGLQQAGINKLATADELQRVGLQRDALLTDNDLATGRAGLTALSKTQPAAISTTLWNELQDIIAHCQEKNRRIGAAIHRGELTTGRALQILKQGYLDDVQLYGATGNAHSSARPQTVAKA